jgi:hypothetical protein
LIEKKREGKKDNYKGFVAWTCMVVWELKVREERGREGWWRRRNYVTRVRCIFVGGIEEK